MFGFEKLDAWKAAIDFAAEVYQATRRFPSDERFGLTSQMRRAAVSISSNIAEGNTRTTMKDRLRFVEIAYGSLMETVSQAHIARQQKFLDEEPFQQLYDFADRLARMLSGLRAYLKKGDK